VTSLDDLLVLRDLDRAGVRERFGDVPVTTDVGYERLDDVDRLDANDPKVHFYLRGDSQEMLYVPEPTIRATGAAALEQRLGEPEASLRSRTGNTDEMLVWPAQGIAAAVGEGAIRLLEVFAPRSLERYQSEIYEDPGAFIR
jgi:hypothetical protein